MFWEENFQILAAILGFVNYGNLKSIFVYLREYLLPSNFVIHLNIYIGNYLESINTTFMPFIKK